MSLKKNFVEAVYERDIDLLLLEEFHVNQAFRCWLTEQFSGQKTVALEFKGAWHSLTETELGESDLILLQKTAAGEKQAIMLENKIDALPQPGQATRYLQRGRAGIEKGYWGSFQTCLVAPERYLSNPANVEGYEGQLSYEAIREWLNEAAEGDNQSARLQYKARLIDEAIEHNRRGYRPVPHEAVTRFWRSYWEFVQNDFPQLNMNRPGEKPTMADWPEFVNPELGPEVKILHKLRFGFVDLQYRNRADQVEELRLANQAILPDDIEIVKANRSAAFRISVPPIDRFKPFADQLEGVRCALEAAVRLLDLFPRIKGL